jgi:cytochrome c553
MTLSRPIILGCIAMSLTATNLASAAPDVELGRYLGAECLTCHRAATASSTIPNIFGIAPATFAQVMKSYRSGQLANPVMQNIAGRLKDDEIEALAAYFATLKRP